MKDTLDIFTLAQEEKQKAITRKLAVREICGRDKTRCFIAGELYEATYPEKSLWFFTGEERTDRQILDAFCESVFGASYQETMEAYDKFLA